MEEHSIFASFRVANFLRIICALARYDVLGELSYAPACRALVRWNFRFIAIRSALMYKMRKEPSQYPKSVRSYLKVVSGGLPPESASQS